MAGITIECVEEIAYKYAKDRLEFANQPIPPFEEREPGVLESCINSQYAGFGGEELHKTLFEKAAWIFYSMIKNHPFVNGNKRIALTTLLVMLFLNGDWRYIEENGKNKYEAKYWWPKSSNYELYMFAAWIAESPPELHKSVLKIILEFLHKNLEMVSSSGYIRPVEVAAHSRQLRKYIKAE